MSVWSLELRSSAVLTRAAQRDTKAVAVSPSVYSECRSPYLSRLRLWIRLPRIAPPKEARCENLEREAVRVSSKSAEIFRWWSSVTWLYWETCVCYWDTDCIRLLAATLLKLHLTKVCAKYSKLAQGPLNLTGKFWKFPPLDMPSPGNHLYLSYILWF